MEGIAAQTYGESFADVYDDWYTGISDAEATARFVCSRAPGGRVVELGVGSGRLVGSLVAGGARVVGLDAARPMLERCHSRHPEIGLVLADMADLPFAEESLDAALCAFNTLFNLPSAASQAGFFADVAGILRPGGVLVIEAMTGTGLGDGPPSSVGVSRMTTTQVVLTATIIDAGAQTISGQHIDLTEDRIRLRPWQIRWTTPEQLDVLAREAGLELAERHADWVGGSFTSDSEAHVSVYRRPI